MALAFSTSCSHLAFAAFASPCFSEVIASCSAFFAFTIDCWTAMIACCCCLICSSTCGS